VTSCEAFRTANELIVRYVEAQLQKKALSF
jgi:hypothetical protein